MDMFNSDFDYKREFIDRWNDGVKRARGWMVVLGVLLIIFGIFTFINPVGQAVFFIVFLGIVLGILGFFFIIQSFSMKKSYKELKKLNEGFKDYDVH